VKKRNGAAATATLGNRRISAMDLRRLRNLARAIAGCLTALAVLPTNLTAGDIRAANGVAVVRTPNGGEPAQARLGADGTIHLLYDSSSDGIPYYVKSSDSGRTFSSPLPVIDTASRKPGLIFSSGALAVGRGGAIYVAASTNNWKLKLPGVPEGFVYSTLASGTKTFTLARSLNGQPSEGFSLAADQNDNVAATWLADKLYANFSRDGGKTFTPNAEINPSYDPCNCCTSRAVYGADGSLGVLYREESNDKRDMYLVILKKDGQLQRNRVSSTLWEINACPMTYYDLAATNNGYIAAWPTQGEIYFARIDKSGKVMAPGEIKTPGRTGTRTGLIALEASDGRALIAWKHQGVLSWQMYSAEGQPEGSPSSISSQGAGVAGVVDKAGKFILFQ